MLTILKASGVLLAAFLFLAAEEHRRQKEVKEAWLIFDTVFFYCERKRCYGRL
jgi:hypothetical protein